MNFIILGVIFLVAVIGIIAVVYITKQSSIPDCSQTDGSSSGVATYKLNDDKSDCVPDTCASGYALSTDKSTCVSTDCSKQDGTAVNVKSYKFDNTLVGCVIDTCVDGSAPNNGACPAPPNPTNIVSTPGNNVPTVIPNHMRSSNELYNAYFGAQGPNLIVIYDSNNSVVKAIGPGKNTPGVIPMISGDGKLMFFASDAPSNLVYQLGTDGNSTSDSYKLELQDKDGNLVLRGSKGNVVFSAL